MKYKDWVYGAVRRRGLHRRQTRALAGYEDRAAWAKKMLTNIAKAGYFSADRTIAQYNAEIWRL